MNYLVINRARFELVYRFVQWPASKSKVYLLFFSGTYALLKIVSLVRCLMILREVEAGKTKFLICTRFGSKSGGTMKVALDLFFNAHKVCRNGESVKLIGGSTTLLTSENSDSSDNKNKQVIVVDSKIMLVTLLFKRSKQLKIQIYVWNNSDIQSSITNLLRKRNNVIIYDYSERNAIWNKTNSLVWKESEYLCKEKHSNAKRGKSVIFVGRLTYQKGVDIFVRIAEKMPNVNFEIYGDGPLKKYVENQVSRLPNLDYRGFVENPICQSHKSSLVVIPSRFFEGVPLVLLESVIHQRRCITSGVGEMPRIKDENHIYPVNESNFERFASESIKSYFF